MKKTRNILLVLFCAILALNTLIYILGEFVQADMAFLGDTSRQTRFIVSTLLILLTMCLLPLSLRLFKFKSIQDNLLKQRHNALLKWGTLRLATMGLLLTANTVLYYAFEFESAYGYLALVVLLCMPFVMPTMNRCKAEVEGEKVKELKGEKESDEETDSSNS